MIRYIDRDHIDEKRWNDCIDRSFNGNLYGYSWFLDIVGPEWGALVEDDYERVFPLVHRKKFGMHYVYQPFFTQQLGLYSTSVLNAEILHDFIRAIPGKFKHAEINLNTLNKGDEARFDLVPQLNHELDLIHSYEKIRAGYSENLLRNLKKAEKAGLSVSKNIRPEEVIALFRENRGAEFPHLRDADYIRLRRIAYTAMYKGLAGIWGVYDHRNRLAAGAFFIKSHNKAVFLFSGMGPEGRETGAMPFLIDSYIRQHAGKHLTFDFDGSNDPNLARFYKSFGSRECRYLRLTVSRLPGILHLVAGTWRKIKRKSKFRMNF